MLRSRIALIVAFIVIALFGALSYAGRNAGVVVYHLMTDGALLVGWLIAAGGIGSTMLAALAPAPGSPGEGWGEGDFEHQRLSKSKITLTPTLSRSTGSGGKLLHLVTAIALGLGTISLLTLGFGLLGWLHHGSTLAIIIAGLLLAVFRLFRAEMNSADAIAWLRAPAGWSWLWLLVCPFAAIAVVAVTFPPGILWRTGDPSFYDVVEYHLQVPREWFEAGRIVPLSHNVFSFFPMNVEMHYLLAMHLCGGPWAGMYLAQLMHLAFMTLFVVAVYAFLLRVAQPLPAITGALAVATVPWVTQLGVVAYDEGGFLLFGTLAIAWVWLAIAEEGPRTRRLVLAGAMAGFACGSKLTAVPEVLIAVTVACAVLLLWMQRTAILPAIRGALLFFIAGVVVFSPWLLRNMRWAGNPVFPEETHLFGPGDFTPVQIARWEHAHSARADQRHLSARFGAGGTEILAGWQYGYVLIPLAMIAVVLTRQRCLTVFLAAVFVAISLIWLFATHLEPRFFVLAIPLCGCLVAQFDRAGPCFAALLIVLIAAGVNGFHLHQDISDILRSPLGEALGLTDLSGLEANYLDGLAPGQDVALIGDAKAFFYTLPMSQLHYRTVFDVRGGDSDLLSAWNDGPIPPGARVIVDPDELRRFHETYWKIPELPAWVLQDAPRDRLGRPMPFVISGPK